MALVLEIANYTGLIPVTFFSFRSSCVLDYVIEVVFSQPVLLWFTYTDIQSVKNVQNGVN